MIYHITSRTAWNEAQSAAITAPKAFKPKASSIARRKPRWLPVAEKFYKGQGGLCSCW
jgi:uncharacterized protein (DUF952 family)